MFAGFFQSLFPNLKKQLRIAHVKNDPRMFIEKMSVAALYLGFGLTALGFFIFAKKMPWYFFIALFPVIYFIAFIFMMQTPFVAIRKRQKEMDMEVLFAGRYLLIKIESGVPLFNALIDASRSYGLMAKYFKEIVDEINTGIPIEKALDNAREYSASKKFKKILAELVTPVKTGVEISQSLKSILQSISNDQILEIKTYSKKINAYIMFYMIMAVVFPSLGMTMLVVASAFLSLELSATFIIIATGILIFIQFMFLSLFRSIRPVVNL